MVFRSLVNKLVFLLLTAGLSLVAGTAPTITTQPEDKTAIAGKTVTFKVVAKGTAPLTYQWSANGSALGGATSATYTSPVTVATDNGTTYSVTVTNGFGTVASSVATLTVNAPPSITTQPVSQTVELGSPVTFLAAASGTGTLSYQWLKNGNAIKGATATTYTKAATVIGDDGAAFSLQATNDYGKATSSAATITLNPVTISVTPATSSLGAGEKLTFTATVTGALDPAVRWTASGGRITSDGIWKAPAAPGSYTITATCKADKNQQATANVNVLALSVSPANAGVTPGGSLVCVANVAGLSNPAVTWTASGGNIDATGTYTAPMRDGRYTITATSQADTALVATVKVRVMKIPVPVISAPLWMAPGATYQASVPDPRYVSFAWSITNGTIISASNQPNITFTASRVGPLTLLCTSSLASEIPPASKVGSLNATVLAPPAIDAFIASPTTLVPGGSICLTATFENGTGSLNNQIGNVISGVPVTVSPTSNTIYTLTVSNQLTSVARQVTVAYAPQQPILTAPSNVSANAGGFTASVPPQLGCSYSWQISGGSILAGTGTSAVTFAAGSAGTLNLACTVSNAGGSASAATSIRVTAGGASAPVITAPATVTSGMAG